MLTFKLDLLQDRSRRASLHNMAVGLVVCLVILTGLAVAKGSKVKPESIVTEGPTALPYVAPAPLRALSPLDPPVAGAADPVKAQAINAAVPISSGPNPGAPPLETGALSDVGRSRALECLTDAVYYEAGNEASEGQRAVAQVILNRVRHPAFPSTICGVVYQGSTRQTGCQFSFTCDGSLARRPSRAEWLRARAVAEDALFGSTLSSVGLATHYHANYVAPYWAPSLRKNAVIGAHLFYRWPGRWGERKAFTSIYRGSEPDAAALKGIALKTEALSQQAPANKSSVGATFTINAALELARARRELGPKHPRLIELEKRAGKGAQASGLTVDAQLATVMDELKTARLTLGPRHPHMIALEERRAKLSQQTQRAD
jgi:hypothetical protein